MPPDDEAMAVLERIRRLEIELAQQRHRLERGGREEQRLDIHALEDKISLALDRLDDNVRSSSPLEAINSQIRDFINSARGQISQHMIDLIVFFLNHKISSRGPYKGTSRYQRFTGQELDMDCLQHILQHAAQSS